MRRNKIGRWQTVVLSSLLLVGVIGGYWLLPISGQVVVIPGDTAPVLLWPQMRLEPPAPQAGQPLSLQVTDIVPWSHVLITLNGRSVEPKSWTSLGRTWNWTWSLSAAETEWMVSGQSTAIVFYHDCHTGCVERGRMMVGATETPKPASNLPTKLGLVFADPQRDWHRRSGWIVELAYVRPARPIYWQVDDLAARVHQALAKGLRVLIRIDYAPGQSLPPASDHLALTEYLDFVRRLARDDRLRGTYGFIIGAGFNDLSSNTLAPDRPVTPQWYARLFNGYGEAISHTDNAVQVIRSENSQARVLVGPVRPWNSDQNGERRYAIDVPWLNYMNTLVALLEETAQSKAANGIPLAAPDGFAVQAPGRLGAPELAGRSDAEEPRLDLRRSEWGQAQAGFRVYQDWLSIINSYPTTRGAPVYITSANTFVPDEGAVPAQNYARGWLTAALDVINQEPQVQALCWFMDDIPGDDQWNHFSLARHPGRLIDAADEFDALLK